ncbi:hypothetical protein HLRTI_002999 [Halorhabdus tiamatea SARL4B]|uniref:Uncharacterized protein n=1 Tax=Halorhabdus tiamatea SARL4B TaxID=1033806 RepID=F7PGN4_9EURY|nr:hypothetical protein [Halorhabdus tiamatea]ERJ05054.1 hypothetical protein HLRTI_002999 [Halorhabdus tiamatea SARL4B]CCQ33079.1 hypothetical protein HTIA_0940 [Halorhabdus tiamatea SARL4B]
MIELLAEILSNYAKVHAVEMGLLLGLFVAFAYRDHEGVAYALLFFGVFFAFFNAAHIGWEEINRYPLYFLSGVYVTTVLGMVGVPIFGRLRDRLVRDLPRRPVES